MPPAQNIHPVGRLSGKCVFLTRTSLTQVPDIHHISITPESEKKKRKLHTITNKQSDLNLHTFHLHFHIPSHRIASHRISYAPNIPHP